MSIQENAKPGPFRNPFYAALMLVGFVFAVTACAYGVMAFRQLKPRSNAPDESPLMVVLDRYGAWMLGGELALLAVTCTAAMLTDDYWMRRAAALRRSSGQARATMGKDVPGAKNEK